MMRPRYRSKTRSRLIQACLLLAAWGLSTEAAAQDSSRESGGVLLEFPNFGPVPGSPEPSLGPGPGALEPSGMSTDSGLIGGRRRFGRIPRGGKHHPVSRRTDSGGSSMRLPRPFASDEAVRSFPLISADVADDEGPADGLTLDQAIDRMLAANLDVLALRHEIPQADADILTAGLRANPLIYGDAQFIPYGSFNDQRPGGPTQYDINLTIPLDLSHKRQARVQVARAARNVLEAQFQDVIRRQIGNVYRGFVDLQTARLNQLSAAASVRAQERTLREARNRPGARDEVDQAAEKFAVGLEKARASLDEARDGLHDAQEALALLLNIPAEQSDDLQPRGSLRDAAPPTPPLDELIRIACEARPDLAAARRGIGRAQAELGLQRANRLDDVYFFYDPFTYQDNRPSHQPSARSWIAAVAVPLPLFNRNQGNIARAQSNIRQSQVEQSAVERRVVSEVRLAWREYQSSKATLDRYEKSILPQAREALKRNAREFAVGKITVEDYLGHLEDEAEAARGFRDALVRHRRGMLDLNTAVGLRLLP